jgi:hypothetical protein
MTEQAVAQIGRVLNFELGTELLSGRVVGSEIVKALTPVVTDEVDKVTGQMLTPSSTPSFQSVVLTNVSEGCPEDTVLVIDENGNLCTREGDEFFDQSLNTNDSPSFEGVSLTFLPVDNTEDTFLVVRPDNTTATRNVATFPVVNPFNQTLNTGDSPQFVNATVTSVPSNPAENTLLLLSGSGSLEQREVSTLPVVNPFNQTLNTGDSPQFSNATITTIPSNPAEDTLLLLSGAGTLEQREVSSLPVVNPFNQTLNTSDSPSFQGVSLTSVASGPTQNEIAVLGPGGSIQSRNVSTLPVVNPFNQDLNTGDSPSFQNVSATAVPVDASENTLLALAPGGSFRQREVSTLPVVNPFNQNLNTGDSPQFVNLTTTGLGVSPAENTLVVQVPGGSFATREVSTLPAVNPFDQPLNTTNSATYTALTLTSLSADSGENTMVVMNPGGLLRTREVSTLPVINPFNQTLNTGDSPTFGSLTLSAVSPDVAEDTLLVVNGLGQLRTREVGTLPGGNPFNQTLNTGDSPTFVGQTLTGLSVDAAEDTLVVQDPSGVLRTREVSTLPVINPFNQPLNTGDNVSFNNATLGSSISIQYQWLTPLADAAEDTLLVLNGSGFFRTREVSTLPVVNPFNQTLNIGDSPTFNGLTTTTHDSGTFTSGAATWTGTSITGITNLSATNINATADVVSHFENGPSVFLIDAVGVDHTWTITRGSLSIATGGSKWSSDDATGRATFNGPWDIGTLGSYFAKIDFTASVKCSSGNGQTLTIQCVGAGLAGPVTNVWGSTTANITSNSDYQTIAFTSLAVLNTGGYYYFTFKNSTSAGDFDILFAKATMLRM